ncbi:hypothetical protein [Bradyrhizobium manausense]|uniref:hypothetical protein n=1 Tax=Bradyrhizobium manausense TaxID=989370 RepID=UPI001BAA018B|nr:hypothetical protein [Bradyrhizobium manausense]MBR0725299.1 hypothetical protein [Bradyrhizobium manausense]
MDRDKPHIVPSQLPQQDRANPAARRHDDEERGAEIPAPHRLKAGENKQDDCDISHDKLRSSESVDIGAPVL